MSGACGAAFDLTRYPVLIVDDDADVVTTFRFAFEDEFTILGATGGRDGLDVVTREPVAVLLCDQRMPDVAGAEVIARALEIRPDIVPIVLTGFVDYQALVKAVNVGSIFRYVPKPWHPQEMREALHRAVETAHYKHENARLHAELERRAAQLAEENRFLKGRQAGEGTLDALIGVSPAMQDVRWRAGRVKDAPTTVLIQGPTGTGKELLARAIHNEGRRSDRLFVTVNCAAVQDTLVESELFGFVKGAFTGAMHDQKGLFQHADKGTIFLDEIGATTLAFQTKILRVIEEKVVRPIGTRSDIPVDVRIIAATSRNLRDAVEKGTFLEDLYHRLSVFPITLPTLDERREDIVPLVRHLLPKLAGRIGVPVPEMSFGAMRDLESRSYRGNVRELANLLERALLLVKPGEAVSAELFFDRPCTETMTAGESAAPLASCDEDGRLKGLVLKYERSVVLDELERHHWSRRKTARALGITPRWLIQLMRRHQLVDPEGRGDDT